MKLNVDLTEIKRAAAETHGLAVYLVALRQARKSYSEGLELAKKYVIDNGGEVAVADNDDVTVITAFGEEAHCFLPYSDIDQFYFEI